jgi:hypothetical protein
MRKERTSKPGPPSRAKRTRTTPLPAISAQRTGVSRSKMLSMPTAKDAKDKVIPRATLQPTIKKTEIYEALYGLNAGIQQFLNSLDFLDRAGLGIPFLNGYRILADEIRSAINFSTTEAMTVIELLDYQQLETLRSRFAFPPIERDLTTETKNCE